MKVLIMAAGRGTRISRHLLDAPKCTVDICGVPLIKRTFSTLKGMGISDIAIVLGYQDKKVMEVLSGFDYKAFYNPFFDVTNSMASLWFARDFVSKDEDLIIMNGDVFLCEQTWEKVFNEKLAPVLFADSSRISEADYRFNWSKGVLKKYGKDLPNEETTGEYVGVAKINKAFIPSFMAQVEFMINTQKHNKWWEDALYSLTEKQQIFVSDLVGSLWAEVDYIEDYERLQELFMKRSLSKSKAQDRTVDKRV